jgi:glycosyltransferase involved in cell wall biosynthesis
MEELLRDRLRRRDERRLLHRARGGRVSCADPSPEPLVTVRITTFRRADLLLERTIPSVLGQTYDRLDVLVVGDATDDETGSRLAALRDPRVRFVNLAQRPDYPEEPRRRWRVLGYQAANLALDLAAGSWIAPSDDDDEFTPEHVEHLVAAARANDAELVHSCTGIVLGGGVLGVIGRQELADGHTSHGALLYSSALRFFRYNGQAWRLRRSLDWDLLMRMRDAGVRATHLDEVTYRYHPAPASLEHWRSIAARRRPDLVPALNETTA